MQAHDKKVQDLSLKAIVLRSGIFIFLMIDGS